MRPLDVVGFGKYDDPHSSRRRKLPQSSHTQWLVRWKRLYTSASVAIHTATFRSWYICCAFLLFALTFWDESTHTQTREILGWNFSSCSLWVIKSRCLEHQLLLSQSVDAIEDHVTSCCGFSARKMHDYQDDSLVVFAKSNIVITTSHT